MVEVGNFQFDERIRERGSEGLRGAAIVELEGRTDLAKVGQGNGAAADCEAEA